MYLDLNIKHRLCVDLEPESDFHVMRQSLLISLFDLSPLIREHLVVDVSQQAFELGLVGTGIGPGHVGGVSQRHVASAELVIDAEDAERTVDGMTAFDTYHRGDFAILVNADHVVRR